MSETEQEVLKRLEEVQYILKAWKTVAKRKSKEVIKTEQELYEKLCETLKKYNMQEFEWDSEEAWGLYVVIPDNKLYYVSPKKITLCKHNFGYIFVGF
jgi:hypothetical protein